MRNSQGNFGRPRLAFANHATSSSSASPSSSMHDFSEHGLFIITCFSERNHPHNISTPTPDANMKTIFNNANRGQQSLAVIPAISALVSAVCQLNSTISAKSIPRDLRVLRRFLPLHHKQNHRSLPEYQLTKRANKIRHNKDPHLCRCAGKI